MQVALASVPVLDGVAIDLATQNVLPPGIGIATQVPTSPLQIDGKVSSPVSGKPGLVVVFSQKPRWQLSHPGGVWPLGLASAGETKAVPSSTALATSAAVVIDLCVNTMEHAPWHRTAATTCAMDERNFRQSRHGRKAIPARGSAPGTTQSHQFTLMLII